MISEYFEQKWNANSLVAKEQVMDFLAANHGCQAPIGVEEVHRALLKIKARSHFTGDGTSMKAWMVSFAANPQVMAQYFARLVCSADMMAEHEIVAKLRGKKTRTPRLSEVRAILPLPPALQVADVIIATALEEWFVPRWPQEEGCFVGGVAKTQTADIGSAIGLALERAEYDHGKCGVAQADVRAFYDRLSPLRISRWLQAQNCPQWIVTAVTVMQLCARVVFRLEHGRKMLRPRFSGGITGSRVAGMCGRIVIADTMRATIQAGELSYFVVGAERLLFASWIDNLYSLACDSSAACRNLEKFESQLQQRWRLDFKADSRTVISASRRDRGLDVRSFKWQCPFLVLGFKIGLAGCPQADFEAAENTIWSRLLGRSGESESQEGTPSIEIKRC